jgi:hypothetical protein
MADVSQRCIHPHWRRLSPAQEFYTYRIADDGKAKTAIDFHLQYLRPLGQPLLPIEPPVVIVSEDERRWAVDYLQQNGWDRRKK